jgi:hypothetical protein
MHGVNTPWHPLRSRSIIIAMKNKINLSGFQIGAAALFVGLAGNVQAIPTTLRDYSASQAVRALEQSQENQNYTRLAASISTKLVKGKRAVARRNLRLANLNHLTLGGLTPLPAQGTFPAGVLGGGTTTLLPGVPVTILPRPLPPVTANGSSPNGVPDGGATAAMMAGSICGLALLRKKIKA